MMPHSDEEKAYIARAKAAPLEFFVSADEIEVVWSMAENWLSRYSSTSFQKHTASVLSTSTAGTIRGYTVTKTPENDGFRVKVACDTLNFFAYKDADYNAHFLAHYLQSGEGEEYKDLIAFRK